MEEERNFARDNAPMDQMQQQMEQASFPPTTIGNTDEGSIRDSFGNNYQNAHSRAQNVLAGPLGGPSMGPSMASNASAVARQNQQQKGQMRGRIHASNDVLNGISGMEHLSNSLANRNKNGITASPAIMAQMRGNGYSHHSS